jgi:hypothetical protein
MKIVSYCPHTQRLMLKNVDAEGVHCLHCQIPGGNRKREIMEMHNFISTLLYGKVEFQISENVRVRNYVIDIDDCEMFDNNMGSVEIYSRKGYFYIDFENNEMYTTYRNGRGEEVKTQIDIKTLFIH